MKYIVYLHKTPNNKYYIGITSKKNPKERWRNGNGYSCNKYFEKAIEKYGWNNIEHIILYQNLTEKEAKEKEIELIAKYRANNNLYGYNLSSGGESSKGYKHTKEQIERQKRNRKRPVYTEETRRKMSESSKKAWERPGYRQMMSEKHKGITSPNKGKKLTEEHKDKIKLTRKVKWVKCLENGVIYRGVRDASEKLGIDRRSVMRVLKREYGFRSVKGYHFEYTEENNDRNALPQL